MADACNYVSFLVFKLDRRLSILLIFSKNDHLVSLFFSIFFSFADIYSCFVISFLLLALDRFAFLVLVSQRYKLR